MLVPLLKGVLAGAALIAVPTLANAEVEYPNVPFLVGSDQVLLHIILNRR
jgi:hypothetical protein